MNGQACLDTEAEVRERRKEFGESEVEFSHITGAALPFSGQPLNSTMLKKLLISFPISWILSPPLSNFQFLCNLQFSGMSPFRGVAFTSMVVVSTTDYT